MLQGSKTRCYRWVPSLTCPGPKIRPVSSSGGPHMQIKYGLLLKHAEPIAEQRILFPVMLKQCELSTLTSEKTTVFQPSLGCRVSLLVKISIVLKLVGRSAQIFMKITTRGSSLIGLWKLI